MSDLLLVGEIGKPHGVAGDVYVVEISDDPRRFEAGSVLIHADGRELTVEGARRHRDRLLVKFEGIESREAAESLRGALYVSASQRRSLGADEYWEDDLLGCTVVTVAGDRVGQIADVVPNPAHPLLVVDADGDSKLIPAVKEIVRDVDLDARTIVVDPPAGLLD